ncbi:MAG: aspartate ammonia-lyase, partial [Ruthenibacterium sp.]
PHIGYQTAADVAKQALAQKQSVKELILERKLLTPEQLDIILNPLSMTEPGITGEELLPECPNKASSK